VQATYRAGIVGCSGIAIGRGERSAAPIRSPLPHSHAAAYHAVPATTVAAVCDVVPAALDNYRATWGEVSAYTDYRQLLARERLDLLSIVTPDHLHADIFVAACEAGVRGIFCEKPVATTLADADRMIAAATRSGVKVVVNHTRRFDPFYRQAKWLLEEGAIGPLRRVVGTMGGERAMLFRNGTHLIDTIAYFVDAPPAWLIAEFDDADAGYGPVYRGSGGRDPQTDPGASAYLHFQNGVRACYNGSKGTATNFEIDLQGERGRLRIGNQVAELSTVVAGGGLATQPLPLSADLRAGMVVAVEELIGLIEGDGDGVAALHAARATLDILLAIMASAASGEKVSFPPAADMPAVRA
jgi:predicted dehydrogenase